MSGLPAHLLARILGTGDQQLSAEAATLRLVCQAWKEGIDASLQGLAPPRWPPATGQQDKLALISHVRTLDLSRLHPAGELCAMSSFPAAERNGLEDGGTSGEASSSYSSYSSVSRSSSYGTQLDLMGAAVLQPRNQAPHAVTVCPCSCYSSRAAQGSCSSAAQTCPSLRPAAGASSSLMCYVASMWPEAVPYVTPAACLCLWRVLPQLQELRHLRLSGSMLLITSVQTAVAGCPDAAAGLRVLQQCYAAAEGQHDTGSIPPSPTIVHTYTLAVPAALYSMTGLRSLAIKWQLHDAQQQQQQHDGHVSSANSGPYVRRRSYEGCSSTPVSIQHVAVPTVALQEQFSRLVSLQSLELAGSVIGGDALLPLRSLQRLQRLVLGPGRIAGESLVPLAAAGVLGGVTQLVLKQQGAWNVRSMATVLAAAVKLHELEVQELEMTSSKLAAGGVLQESLTAADVSPLARCLTRLCWSTSSQRLSAGASLLCRSLSAAVLPGDLGSQEAPGAGSWFGGLAALQSLQLQGVLRDGSVLGAPVLDTLSSSIGSCSKLEQLSIRCLGLPLLPQSLSQLPVLRSVTIEACSITRRQALGPDLALDVLGRCKSLEELTLGGCELRHVPNWLSGLQQVTALRLHGNYLQDLPSVQPLLGLPAALQQLDLTDNRLRVLPDGIEQLSSLTQLVLDSNYLTSLPATIWELPELVELSVRENMLSELPQCSSSSKVPGDASSSRTSCCDSYSTGYSGTGSRRAVGAAAAVLVAAAAPVQAGGVGLGQEAAALLSTEEEDLLTAIGVLQRQPRTASTAQGMHISGSSGAAAAACLSAHRAHHAHEQPQQQPCRCAGSLRVLVLAENQLAELPCSVSQLSALQSLNLSKNQLRSLPDKAGLWALSRLTSLQLADNHLRKLPGGLAKLQHLLELDVSGNHLAVSVPTESASAAGAAAAVGTASTAAGPTPTAATAAGSGPCSPTCQAYAGPAAGTSLNSSSSMYRAAPGQITSRAAGAAPGTSTATISQATIKPGALGRMMSAPESASAVGGVGAEVKGVARKTLKALPCPLSCLPRLQEVRLGRQQAEGSSKCPLQLLLGGIYELAERLRGLAPPGPHQCPVAKAAAAAVAHIAGVTAAGKARAIRKQQALKKSEPDWLVVPAASA